MASTTARSSLSLHPTLVPLAPHSEPAVVARMAEGVDSEGRVVPVPSRAKLPSHSSSVFPIPLLGIDQCRFLVQIWDYRDFSRFSEDRRTPHMIRSFYCDSI